LKVAVDEAIEDHRQKNVPIVMMKDNQMRFIDPALTKIRNKKEKYKSNNNS